MDGEKQRTCTELHHCPSNLHWTAAENKEMQVRMKVHPPSLMQGLPWQVATLCLEMNWIRAIWKLFQDTKSRFQMVLWPMSDFSICSVSVPILWSFGKSFVQFVPAVWRPSASVFHGTLMSLTSKETDVHPSRCIWSSCYVRFLGRRVFIKTVTCNRTGLCL